MYHMIIIIDWGSRIIRYGSNWWTGPIDPWILIEGPTYGNEEV